MASLVRTKHVGDIAFWDSVVQRGNEIFGAIAREDGKTTSELSLVFSRKMGWLGGGGCVHKR